MAVFKFCLSLTLAALCLGLTAQAQTPRYTVQLQSLPDEAEATALAAQLRAQGVEVYVQTVTLPDKGRFHRVRTGRFQTQAEARRVGAALRRAGVAAEYFVARYEDDAADVNPAPRADDAAQADEEKAPLTESRYEFETRHWFTDIRAAGQVNERIENVVTQFNILPEFRRRTVPDIRFLFRPTKRGKLRVDFTYFNTRAEDLRLDGTIDDTPLNLNTGLVSQFSLRQFRVSYAWQGLNIKNKFKVGPLVEARLVRLKARLDEPVSAFRGGSPTFVEERVFVPLPGFGVDVNAIPHRRVNLFATVSGTPGGRYGRLVDGEAGVKVAPLDQFSIVAGYRIFDVKARNDNEFARLRFGGFFVGTQIMLGKRYGED